MESLMILYSFLRTVLICTRDLCVLPITLELRVTTPQRDVNQLINKNVKILSIKDVFHSNICIVTQSVIEHSSQVFVGCLSG